MTGSQAAADRWFPLIPIGLGAVLVLMGSISGYAGWHQHQKQQAIDAWPSTEGTVTSCVWSKYQPRVSDRAQYSAHTQFTYVVDGRTYEQTFVESRRRGEEVGAVPYTAGQKVPVYFDPQAPSVGSLTRDGGPSLIFLFVGAICALISLPFFFFGVRGLMRRQRAG